MPLSFASFAAFLGSGLSETVTEVLIDDVLYKERAADPLHRDFKYQDTTRAWWSPDYFVVVAAGQSNMVGSGFGGSLAINPNVMAYDAVANRVVAAAYGTPPTTSTTRNNLFFPFANEIAETVARPVLVIAAPVSGSRIDSWLASGTGVLWQALEAQVDLALALVGQGRVDSFIWHQGETDYPLSTDEYKARVMEFVGQVRAEDWAPEDMAFLIGELSREGVNSEQNRALQELEIEQRADRHLQFVSSVGLTSHNENGVHFDGASLLLFGMRFAQALWQTQIAPAPEPPVNTAPVVALAPDAILSVTLAEGQRITLSPEMYFQDAEGDALWLYGALVRRGLAMLDGEGRNLVIRPDFQSAGTHFIDLYASDYNLDSARVRIALTVTEANPAVQVFTSDFTRLRGSYADFDWALAPASKSAGIVVMQQSALSADGSDLVTLDNLRIGGSAGLTGLFEMGTAVKTLTLVGSADFAIQGNDLANQIYGNLANNRLSGGEGADRLFGGSGVDRIEGGTGADHLDGGAMDDLLTGGTGDDRLYGGTGNDRLEFGTGNDQGWGGAGADVFVFAAGDGRLSLRDLTLGEDRIEMRGLTWNAAGGPDAITSFAEMMAVAVIARFSSAGIEGVRLSFGTDQVMLFDTTRAELSADLFLFV